MRSDEGRIQRGVKAAGCAALFLLMLCGGSSSCAQSLDRWSASWTAAGLQVCDRSLLPKLSFHGATLREVVHLSLGGTEIRLRLSNAFGDRPLRLSAVTVARPRAGEPGAIAAGTSLAVRFHGEAAVSIPAGAEYLSDPIALPVGALSDVAVSLAMDDAPPCATSHPGARATAFLAQGEHGADQHLAAPESFAHWYFLSAVEVENGKVESVVAVLGDSITDGRGSADDANNRWTDVLASRLAPLGVGVANLGIGGNRILNDGLGPSALARFDRDVLGTAGVRTLIVLEGINDIGDLDRDAEHTQVEHDSLVAALEEALRQMAAKAHEHGLRVLGGTLTPFVGSAYYHPGPRSEADRQKLNQWIRSADAFDGVMDFDALLRDPAHPERLLPEADSGDHLHPGTAAYRRMGEAVPLGLLLP
jgi:lysophospholipase L1-like esterase